MNIVAVGCSLQDLAIGCFGTLSKLVKKKYEVYLLTARSSGQDRSEISSNKLGTELHLPDIDLSSVTQHNVYSLRKLMEQIKPSTLFIPDAASNERSVLARSAITAGKGINNILTYEVNDSNFSPCFYSDITAEIEIKRSLPSEILLKHKLYADSIGIDGFVEAFECSKLLLDNELTR